MHDLTPKLLYVKRPQFVKDMLYYIISYIISYKKENKHYHGLSLLLLVVK